MKKLLIILIFIMITILIVGCVIKQIQRKEVIEESNNLDIKNNGFDLDIAPKIGVAIDRDGNILHYRQGNHTLAIAKLLGIEHVKVRIRAVHSIWLRKQIKKNKIAIIKSLRESFKSLAEEFKR